MARIGFGGGGGPAARTSATGASAMPWRHPAPADLLGYGGLIPFLGLALLSALGLDWATRSATYYGAAILSFLGAVHWGVALRALDDEADLDPWRLGLGILPSLVAWAALSLLGPTPAAAGAIALGILATNAVEALGGARGAVASSWLRLRWRLSLGAALSLGILATF